jgi:hypothetical protein
LNRPEAVDHDPLVVFHLKEVDELEAPVGLHLIRKDLAVPRLAMSSDCRSRSDEWDLPPNDCVRS